MHKPESVLGNETQKILWDFEIQTDHVIPAKRPDQEIVKNRTCRLVDFDVPTYYRMKIKKGEKRGKY